jgi:hypothetical protein
MVTALILLSGISAASQTKSDSTGIISDSDFKTFLSQVETALPKWEAALKNINPEQNSQISYALGNTMVQNRSIGLAEIPSIRIYIAKLRSKRTVSGELTLSGLLRSVYDCMDYETTLEAIANLKLTDLEKFAPEFSAITLRIANDVIARVALLEKGTCP